MVLEGELDVASAGLLERTIAQMCSTGATEVVVELGRLDFIDSSGMNAILQSRMRCGEHECAFSLAPGQHPAQRLFEITQVLEQLPFGEPSPRRHGRETPARETILQ